MKNGNGYRAYSDEKLMGLFQAGDIRAFEYLYERHKTGLKTFLTSFYPSHADDILQETFMKIYQKRGTFRNDKNFRVWASAIAKNTAIDFIRKEKKRTNFSMNGYEENVSEEDSVMNSEYTERISREPLQISELAAKEIKEAIERLPCLERNIINLVLEGYKHGVIAGILGKHTGTIGYHKHIARTRLQYLLEL